MEDIQFLINNSKEGTIIDVKKSAAVSVASVDDSSVCLETSSLFCIVFILVTDSTYFFPTSFSKRGLWYIKVKWERLGKCESMGKIEEYVKR